MHDICSQVVLTASYVSYHPSAYGSFLRIYLTLAQSFVPCDFCRPLLTALITVHHLYTTSRKNSDLGTSKLHLEYDIFHPNTNRFAVSCMKLVILFLPYNNLFIYQALCSLTYPRPSLHSFLMRFRGMFQLMS